MLNKNSSPKFYRIRQIPVTVRNSDIENMLGYEISSDILAEAAAAGFNARRMAWCDQNTVNTPFKAGLTESQNGLAIISMSSANNGSILYITAGTPRLFVRSKNNGNWGEWNVIANADIQHGTQSLGEPISAGSAKTYSVIYPLAFRAVPDVVVSLIINLSDMDINKLSVHIATRTATGFTFVVQNGSDSQYQPAISWIACI